MQIDELIEGVLRGEIEPQSLPTEADWHRVWRDRALSDAALEVMAALGGALADRLAWVFLSGYQATIYRCFPDLPREAGWTSFVNTEDRSGVLPGTALAGDGDTRRLNGWKGWLAASDHAERLLVSARQEETPFVLVRRDTAGVRIESREANYLSELTQGRVEFVDVTVPDALLTGDEHTFPTFRASETAYVRVALHAFMLSHARRLAASTTLVGDIAAGLLGAVGVVRLPLPSRGASVAMLGADRGLQRLVPEFEALLAEGDPELLERWTRDRRLVTSGSERLAARAEAALAD